MVDDHPKASESEDLKNPSQQSDTTPNNSSEADDDSASTSDFDFAEIHTANSEQNQPSLQERLQAFLPQIRAANSSLNSSGSGFDAGFELAHEDDEHEDEGYSSDSSREQNDGAYIELNLGLGVLEEVRDGKDGEELLSSAQSNLQKRKADDVTDTGGVDDTTYLDSLTSVAGSQKKKRRRDIEVLDDGNI